MAGVRKFDDEAVLDQAMKVFWARGYEGTSVDDLVEATGLKRGSLYNAFGDKEQLFLRVLDRYEKRFLRSLVETLGGADARRALARMLETQITWLTSAGHPAGCLMANTFAESAHCKDAVGQAALGAAATTESAIYDLLRRAQAEGQLDAGHDARALARFFTAVSRGVAQLHRSGGDARALRDVAQTALLVLDAPPAKGRVEIRGDILSTGERWDAES
jgi:TetR/AcrR family transcriptional regulator, transcriptional repressor for nem operon